VLVESNLTDLKELIDLFTANSLQETVRGAVNVPCDQLLMMIHRLEDKVASSPVRFIEILARSRDFPPGILPQIKTKLAD
jgi:hypothetical protein